MRRSRSKPQADRGSEGKNGLPPQLMAELKELLEHKRDDLEWHHAVGRLIHSMLKGAAYGEKRMATLLKELGYATHQQNKLYEKAKLYGFYPHARDFAKLCGLSYGQVSVLITMDKDEDKEDRERFRKACRQHKWSVKKLQEKVKERFGKRSSGGQRFEKEKDVGPRAALQRIQKLHDEAAQKVFPPLDQNLQRLAKRLSRKANEELAKEVDAACGALKALQAAAAAGRKKLESIRKHKASRKARS